MLGYAIRFTSWLALGECSVTFYRVNPNSSLILDRIRTRYIPFALCLYLRILGYLPSRTIYLISTDPAEDVLANERCSGDLFRRLTNFRCFLRPLPFWFNGPAAALTFEKMEKRLQHVN